jgi:hypothetical protein
MRLRNRANVSKSYLLQSWRAEQIMNNASLHPCFGWQPSSWVLKHQEKMWIKDIDDMIQVRSSWRQTPQYCCYGRLSSLFPCRVLWRWLGSEWPKGEVGNLWRGDSLTVQLGLDAWFAIGTRYLIFLVQPWRVHFSDCTIKLTGRRRETEFSKERALFELINHVLTKGGRSIIFSLKVVLSKDGNYFLLL